MEDTNTLYSAPQFNSCHMLLSSKCFSSSTCFMSLVFNRNNYLKKHCHMDHQELVFLCIYKCDSIQNVTVDNCFVMSSGFNWLCISLCVLSPFGVSGGVQLTLSACGDKGVTSGAGTLSGVLSSVCAWLGGLKVHPPPVQALP